MAAPLSPEDPQQPQRMTRRKAVIAGVGALAAASAAGVYVSQLMRDDAPANAIQAAAIQGELPINDPAHALWNRARPVAVAVQPQRMAPPMLEAATIPELQVRALWNGSQLGLRFEWGDEHPDELVAMDTFRDAVAVMLPLTPPPSPDQVPPIFMGLAGKPVYILHWKASWQKDVDAGFQGVEKSFPNGYNDVYPGHPRLEELGMTQEAATVFYPGLARGNPMSQRQRTSPIEEMTAEQYGTLTHLPQQRAQGKGIYTKGRWQVCVGVPTGADAPVLKSGTTTPVAFAAWDGSHQQRGSRKHYTQNWFQLALPEG